MAAKKQVDPKRSAAAKKAAKTRSTGRWKQFYGKGTVVVRGAKGSTAYTIDGRRRILYRPTDLILVPTSIGEVVVPHEGTSYHLDVLHDGISAARGPIEQAFKGQSSPKTLGEALQDTNSVLDLPWEEKPKIPTQFSMNVDGVVTVHGGEDGPVSHQYKVGQVLDVPAGGYVSILQRGGLQDSGPSEALKHAQEEDLRDNNVMSQALSIIYGDREKTYGRPDLNLESIAQLWSVYLQRKAVVAGTHDQVSVDDVCQMMVLLKMARLLNDPSHKDSMTDQIGYIGLQERVQVARS